MSVNLNGDTGVSKVQSGTVEQADLAANVVGNGPAFYAYQNSAQTVPLAFTKINLQAELYDTASCFDTGTYRFTPNVAGYYQINATVSNNNGGQHAITIYKNGANYSSGNNTNSAAVVVSTLIYMNGTTDYIELFCYGAGTALTAGTSTTTFMCGFLARAA